ncbi:DUF7437 domain-containing protein [Halomarina oriensis]|uniref:DUF7437 domain-containing protein n=1 Tax=Halomarina oriensis TaxID=671145 RepID=A0A6B0GTI6_9EURY|nr:hypothetical protein [Halomarina oriensis]MWG36687.1 hypothetical protein [Halomarina oriensis]
MVGRAIQYLLHHPDTAFVYSDLLINGPSTPERISDRTNVPYSGVEEQLGVLNELGSLTSGDDTTWSVLSPVKNSEHRESFTLTLIAVIGASTRNDDITRFLNDYDLPLLSRAVQATYDYIDGTTTRRGIAHTLDITPAAAIAISQIVEDIITVFNASGHIDRELPAATGVPVKHTGTPFVLDSND